MGLHLDLQVGDRGRELRHLLVHGEGVEDPQGVAEAKAVRAQIGGDAHQFDEKRDVGSARVLAADADVKPVRLGETQGAP